MPVARFVAETAAPTITAPLASVMVPTREPVAPVAKHNLVSSESPATHPSSKCRIAPSLLQHRLVGLLRRWSPGHSAGSAHAKAGHDEALGSGRLGPFRHYLPYLGQSLNYSPRSFGDCASPVDGAIVA